MSLDGSDAAVVGFSTGDARRIAEAVRRDERRFRNTQGVQHRRRRWPVGGGGSGSPAVPARVTANIAAGSMSAPASFTATLLTAGTNGALVAGSTTVGAYNAYTGSVTASTSTPKLIWLVVFGGTYYLLNADCQ